MSLLSSPPTVRRLAATIALAQIAALALGFCICEMPLPREKSECHESVEATPLEPIPEGVWSRGCCCSSDLRLPPGTLEARAPEAQRGAKLLAAASAFAARMPTLHEASLTPASPWLVSASPPHAPPSSFVLPLRV